MAVKRSLFGVLALLVVCLAVSSVWAEVGVTLTNGTTFTGALVEKTKDSVIIRTQGGTRTIKIDELRSMDFNVGLKGSELGSLVRQEPSATLSPEAARLLLQARGFLPYTPTPMPVPTEDILASSLLMDASPTQLPVMQEALIETPVAAETPTEATETAAPEKTDEDIVHLEGGKIIKGYLVEERENVVVLRLKYGNITLSRSQISIIERNSQAGKSQ